MLFVMSAPNMALARTRRESACAFKRHCARLRVAQDAALPDSPERWGTQRGHANHDGARRRCPRHPHNVSCVDGPTGSQGRSLICRSTQSPRYAMLNLT